MRVGIDASRANTKQKTGTEWYSFHVIQQLKNLIPEDIEVILYSKEPLEGELATIPSHWKSRVLSWPPQFLWTQLRLSVELFLHKVDLLYIPAHTIPLIHPKKVVTVIHDVGFARQDNLYNHKHIGKSRFSKNVLNMLVRIFTLGKYGASEFDYHTFSVSLALSANARIVTVSEFSKSEIQDVYATPPHQITVIPNGLNKRKSGNNASEILRTYGITRPFIFYIGRVEEKKNIPALIEAFSLLRSTQGIDTQLVLAGQPGFGHERVMKNISQYKLEDTVIQTGWISEEDVATLMSQAVVFVLPSLYEGFGIPILEAMNEGIPVACSDIPALREVGGSAALFFDPNSATDMANTIAKIMNTDSSKQITAGHAQAELFSWEQSGKATWELLRTELELL